MLDFQGSIIEDAEKIRILLSDQEDDDARLAISNVSSIETTSANDCLLKTDTQFQCNSAYEIKWVRAIIDIHTLVNKLNIR